MKKKFIFLFLIIFFTGCDVTYNVKIDNKINESTDIIFKEHDYNYKVYNYKTEYYDSTFMNNFSSADEFTSSIIDENYLAFDGDYNDKKLYNTQKINGGMRLNYTYEFNNYEKSSLINYCRDAFNLSNLNNSVLISVIDFSNCFLTDTESILDSLTINISTNLKVLENNADKVNGNVYTWNIEANEASDKSLYIMVHKAGINKNANNYNIIFVILGILVFFGVLASAIVFYVLKKQKESNEI